MILPLKDIPNITWVKIFCTPSSDKNRYEDFFLLKYTCNNITCMELFNIANRVIKGNEKPP